MTGDGSKKIQKSGIYASHRYRERNSRPRKFILTNHLDLNLHLMEYKSDAG